SARCRSWRDTGSRASGRASRSSEAPERTGSSGSAPRPPTPPPCSGPSVAPGVARPVCSGPMATPALPEPADVLAFGPHPDDVELCAGGLLLRMRRAGHRCVVVDLTRGESGSRGSAEIRARETAAASALLGLVGRENLGLP